MMILMRPTSPLLVAAMLPARQSAMCRRPFVSPLATLSGGAPSTSDETPPLPLLPDGVFVLDKPPGWTSFDCVGRVRGTLEKHFKREGYRFGRRSRLKVGHGGTLDPLATGLLVIGVGGGCRRLQSYLQGAKGYSATAQLGRETDTQDSEGSTIGTADFDHVARGDLERAAGLLTGTILQRPPIYSALRKDGKRLHELARAGEITPEEVEPRSVTVYRLGLDTFDGESGAFDLSVRCSGGTYVRSLIVEMAREAGSAAHMTALRRTQHGPFCTAEAYTEAVAEAATAEAHPRVVAVPPVGVEEFGDAQRILHAISLAGEALAALPPPPAAATTSVAGP